jgi:hypothetical protein
MPGAGSAQAEAISAGRHEMLTDTLRKQIKSLAERGLKRPRIGADASVRSPPPPGRGRLLRLPGRRASCPSTTSWAITRNCATSSSATNRAPRTPPTATPEPPARSACASATSGPGATNLVTGIGNAMLDSVPMVAITGNVVSVAPGQGRLPGDRHHRHHAAVHQAQLPGPRPQRDPARRGRGVPHRRDRPPGPRPHRHDQGRPDGRLCTAEHPDTLDLPGFKPNFEGHPARSSSRPRRSPGRSGPSSWPATAS